MPAVKPEILTWARETAGLSVEEAAHELGYKDTRNKTATEKLLALESGEIEPTRAM